MSNVSFAYRSKDDEHPLDRRIAAIADAQHGLITTRQLSALGLDSAAIARRVAAGRLYRQHQGIYSVGVPSLSACGRDLAAVLAYGNGALLGRRSAAVRWQIRTSWRGPVEVAVPVRKGARKGIRPFPRAAAGTTLDRIPITTPVQTIIDLADVSTEFQLEKDLGRAERRELLDRADITPIRGRRGYGRLTRVLRRDHLFTRSELEDAFVKLIRSSDLPEPKMNRVDDSSEVDAVWADLKVMVELDGYGTHGNRAAFEHDRERDAERIADGWIVLRFTYRQITQRPEWVLAKIRRTLALRRAL